MSLEAVEELIGFPVIGVVPEDVQVKKAMQEKKAVMEFAPRSKASFAYSNIASSLLGEEVKSSNFFSRLFGL